MNSTVPAVKLNDGHTMPQLGLGVWQVADDVAAGVVKSALEVGYRQIDTASIYGNEKGVGRGIASSGVPREEIFLTTKVWNSDQGTDATVAAVKDSLARLDTPYVDLLLIHWPVAGQDRYLDTWKTMIELKEQGLARSIGVSNFHQPHLERIVKETGVVPAVNQIELHPYLQQAELRKVHEKMGIHTESWSPLAQGHALKDEAIASIAQKHGKTTAQVIIRWHLDNGFIVIPKSEKAERIAGNFDVLDFALDEQDKAAILALNQDKRFGPDPDTFG